MLLPHSDVSRELEPKVITLRVSAPMLSLVDLTSDRENCPVLSHFAKQLQKALVCFTHHFLAQNRELSLLPKYIWPLTSSSFSLNSWLGEFCSVNIGKFTMLTHKGHLALGATYLPYASKALYSDLLRVLSTSGKGQDLIKMPAVLGELTRWLFCISSFCNYYLENALSFIPRSYTTKVF